MADKSETPLLDELEKGKWPSFVKEMKRAAEKNRWPKTCCVSLNFPIGKDRHWKHGGIVGVKGYGVGSSVDIPTVPISSLTSRPSTPCG